MQACLFCGYHIAQNWNQLQPRLTVSANATGADAMQFADLQLWVGSACSGV